jgi:uncharacterized protein (DUF1330 family)
MAAYAVIDVYVTDEDAAARYRELSGPSVMRHGGRFLARGGVIDVLEGDWHPARLVVIEFDSADEARAWYESDDYAEARAVRQDAGDWRVVIVDGVR